MSKIDCSTVIDFVHEANRVCTMYDDCGECPFSGRKKCPTAILKYDKPDVQAIVDALQKWSDEHPQKTRLDDFKEKYPNAKLNAVGTPSFHPYSLGYCDSCLYCTGGSYSVCWNEPLEGGATGKAVE